MSKVSVRKIVGKGLVMQANEITQAAYSLSLPAKRILSMCLHQVGGKADHDGVFTISVADYARFFPSDKTRVSKDVRKGVQAFQAGLITFRLKDDPEGWESESIPWLQKVAMKKENTPAGVYRLQLHPDLLPLIRGVKERFTKYALDDLGAFSSANQQRLYECFCQFRKSGIWITSRDKIAAMLPDLSEGTKRNGAEMKRSLILPAIERVNSADVDLFVSFQDNSGDYVFNILSGAKAKQAKARAKLEAVKA